MNPALVSGNLITAYKTPDFVFQKVNDKTSIRLLPLEKPIQVPQVKPKLVPGRKITVGYAPRPMFGNVPVPNMSGGTPMINRTDTGTC
jgi:hypothetical protein